MAKNDCNSCNPSSKEILYQSTSFGKKVVVKLVKDTVNPLHFVAFIPKEHSYSDRGKNVLAIINVLTKFAASKFGGKPYKIFFNSSLAAKQPDHLHAHIAFCPDGKKSKSFTRIRFFV